MATSKTMAAAAAAYPGTAFERMLAVRERAKSLTREAMSTSWTSVRQSLLWAAGLRDLTNVEPGMGYTGHSFNDFNHVDACCMAESVDHNTNSGQVQGIHFTNQLGPGVRIASLPELGPGGTWSTCQMGCNKEPPQDVAHVQFKSQIAFKLVWSPSVDFKGFVLVDDDGGLLNVGWPQEPLPPMRERQMNYECVKGSKYATEADRLVAE